MPDNSAANTTREQRLQADQALIQQVQAFLRQREPDALLTAVFEEFHRTYSKVLHGMAKERGFRGAERDDLVQEVWLQLLKHLRAHDWTPRGGGLRGWLYRLVCNKACDVFRARRRLVANARASELDGVADAAAGWDDGDLGMHFDEQLLDQLMKMLNTAISPLNRRLLTLLWIERRPRAEIARSLNLSPQQIKYRQYRVFGKLRTAMAVYRGEPIPG